MPSFDGVLGGSREVTYPMNKELFGVYGGIETFERFRSRDEFDRVFDGPSITVGIRDPGLGTPGWSACHQDDDGCCVVWGEVYAPGDETNAARWLFERYETAGSDALSELNGSHLAVLDREDADGTVITDQFRSRECFYTDDPGVRVFGTDSAAIARTIPDPTLHRDGVLEFLHLGVILGTKTCVKELRRLPIDSRLTTTGVRPLDRFVYDPQAFDYVTELADRLRRALRRRSILPGPAGVLLSAGYDSRILLSQLPEIEHGYTVGSPTSQEARGAKQLADQYDASHSAFPPDERYLLADETKVRYSQGIKESLHIHHAGYTDLIDVETIYHGLLCDTFFRGHFTAREEFDVLGKRVRLERPDPDPEPVTSLLNTFGYSRDASRQLARRTSFDVDPESFVKEAIADELDALQDRTTTVQNAITCCGIANQPSLPFHVHLSDHFFSAFLAADLELIDWHLRTPASERTTETFLRACERLDDDILRHRPPDRPHDISFLNEVEGFVRRKTPFLPAFETPWPDREVLFDRYEFDQRLLPDLEHVHALPARHKLRVVDFLGWRESWSDGREEVPSWLLPPSQPTVY